LIIISICQKDRELFDILVTKIFESLFYRPVGIFVMAPTLLSLLKERLNFGLEMKTLCLGFLAKSAGFMKTESI